MITEDNLNSADGILTKFGIILKKHWGKLLFLLFCYCVYWAFTQPVPQDQFDEELILDDSIYQDSI